MMRAQNFAIFVLVVQSSSIVLYPCKVENALVQPLYGTSLISKKPVQIVQIPPIFTQSVVVGKCVNESIYSHSPGSYFICQQRFSAVEVYVKSAVHPDNTAEYNRTDGKNFTLSSAVEKFSAGNYLKEFVVVESGCDFSFNLLPLLMKKEKIGQTRKQKPYQYMNPHILNSPYLGEHKYPPITSHPSKAGKLDPFNIASYLSSKDLKVNQDTQKNYEQGGNVYSTDSKHDGKYQDAKAKLESYLHKPSPGAYKLNRVDHEEPAYKISEYPHHENIAENKGSADGAYGEHRETSKGNYDSYKPEKKLQAVPHKVGMPVHILSSHNDLLLKEVSKNVFKSI